MPGEEWKPIAVFYDHDGKRIGKMNLEGGPYAVFSVNPRVIGRKGTARVAFKVIGNLENYVGSEEIPYGELFPARAKPAEAQKAAHKSPPTRGPVIVPEHLRPGYRELMVARYDGLDAYGWSALMTGTLHLPLSMLPAVKHAVKMGIWRQAKDPVKCVTEAAEREMARMGLRGEVGRGA